eukprot:1138702-Pelagomonas_calceolata.AAC.7
MPATFHNIKKTCFVAQRSGKTRLHEEEQSCGARHGVGNARAPMDALHGAPIGVNCLQAHRQPHAILLESTPHQAGGTAGRHRQQALVLLFF